MSSLIPKPSEAALCDDYLAARKAVAGADSLADLQSAHAVRDACERRVIELIRYRQSVIQHGVYRFMVEYDELIVVNVPRSQLFKR